MAPRPLVVYCQNATFFNHSRRVYVAARTLAQGHRISGFSTEGLKWGISFPAGSPQAPTFIQEEGVWLEIRDHSEEGGIYPDWKDSYSVNNESKRKRKIRPANIRAAWINCTTLEACKEAFTLKLDRALAAAGVPREEL
jgi:hypothetical protein